MPFFLLGAAAGAVAAALFSHSNNEPNRQKSIEYRRKAEYYEREAHYYKNNYTNVDRNHTTIKQQHDIYVAQSQERERDLLQKLARTDEDKSGFRVIVRYQQDFISLMFGIDTHPSREALRKLHHAVLAINRVLVNLGEEQIAMPSDYRKNGLKAPPF